MLGFYSGTSEARITFPIFVSGIALHLSLWCVELCGVCVCVFTPETPWTRTNEQI